MKLLPFFSYNFNGLIFKILPDIILPFIAIEVRNLQVKEVSFAVVNYQKGELLFEGLGLEETWWVGISGLRNGKLFFHQFADKEYPEPQALLVADVLAQALIWGKKGSYLEELTANGALVSILEHGQKRYQLLDIESGNLVKEITDSNEVTYQEPQNMTFPIQYEQGSPYFDTVAQFLKQKLDVVASKQIDYCEFGDKIIISYTTDNQRFLLILNSAGEMLFHQSILQESQGLGMESFFIKADYLICVAERQHLLIFKLD